MVALTWKHARSILRRLLLDYLDGPSPRIETTISTCDGDMAGNKPSSFPYSCMEFWLRNDMDLYGGALFLSVALLILACFAYISSENGGSFLNAGADHPIYPSQLAAAILLMASSFVGIWMVRRRQFACLRDVDSVKRREIKRFLKSMESKSNQATVDHSVIGDYGQQGVSGSLRRDSSTSASPSAIYKLDTLKLPGTALTDIYPVYRLSESGQGSWCRVPTLLVVEGDYVALQVGDIAPARCKLVSEGDEPSANTIEIEGRDRVTLESFGGQQAATFPKGRTTLPTGSKKLLELCNSLQVFVLLESPLNGFLRRPLVEHKTPLVLRQLQAIRASLSILALILFMATILVIFARPDITSIDISFILPIPFLASLGVLPVGSPSFLIFLEILGTARILVAVHPHSSFRHTPSSTGNNDLSDTSMANNEKPTKDRLPLLARYILATTLSRLWLKELIRSIRLFFRSIVQRRDTDSKQADFKSPKIIRVPPASVYLLEKLGVATAFTLVDDELACEPHALPQQLLIPSGKGLKLLDMCPTYEDESGDESTVDPSLSARRRNKSFDVNDHDSDTDSDGPALPDVSRRRTKKKNIFRLRRKRRVSSNDSHSHTLGDGTEHALPVDKEVQFEDPNWWQHLPALKCIGLACLIVDDKVGEIDGIPTNVSPELSGVTPISTRTSSQEELQLYKDSLVRFISAERRSNQLRALANCIGFSTEPNQSGEGGDVSPFTECLRLHVISNPLVKERLEMDPHERGSEEARWWGLLRPDSTSVIIKDARSNAYQLLTAGDPEVVTTLCHEAWQGENSTILPLASRDRVTILETSKSWKLADLDVSAFGYAPIPHTVEKRLGLGGRRNRFYLLDNSNRGAAKGPISLKDKTLSQEWSLINNQIFLGVLGSLVVPRKEIQLLLSTLSDAGVRFVYFSPRNMRRQKELASQMGIDVAWNCAISLRPLESGEDDPHRMVSNYADWDVNAKLPHGLDNVRTHLREVDNVPLLVSLFTDVTKGTTKGMIATFQEYHDTVIAVGLSHLPRNSGIFATADISVAIDIFTECLENAALPKDAVLTPSYSKVLPAEITFVSAISAHSCVFRLRGATASSHIPSIIAQGRAALESTIAAVHFYVSGCLSLSFYMFFCACAVSTALPFVPILAAVCYLLFLLPIVGVTMAWSDPDKDSMNRVPPKNDSSVTFGRNERGRLFTTTLLKALLPAALPQLLHLIAYGELIIYFDPNFVETQCSGSFDQGDWALLLRCDALKEYSGVARTSAGSFVFAELILCTIVASCTYVHGTIPIRELHPWNGNRVWAYSVILGLLIVVAILLATDEGSFSALPWYFYVLALVMPPICIAWNEFLKQVDRKHEMRAEKLRRLQFETRLGMWSPK